MPKEYILSDEDTGDIYPVSAEEGLDMPVFEDKKKCTALVVAYVPDLPTDYRRKMMYRLVKKTEKGPGPKGMPVLIAEGEGLRYISNPAGSETSQHYKMEWITDANMQQKALHIKMFELYADFSHNNKKVEVETKEREDMEVKKPSYREQTEGLVESFGSSKGHRLVRTRQRNALASQDAVEVDFVKAVDDSEAVSALSILTGQPAINYLPPYHINATRPQDVYLISDLLTEAEMDSLFAPAQVFINSNHIQIEDWRRNKTYSGFVLKYLEFLPTRGEERTKRSELLMYFHILFFAWHLKAADWKYKKVFAHDLIHSSKANAAYKGDERTKLRELPTLQFATAGYEKYKLQLSSLTDCLPTEFPQLIKQKVLAEFTKTTPGRPTVYVPKELKDKLLLHLCVIALIISDFTLDFTILEDDTGRKLRVYFEQLGCKVMTANKGESCIMKAVLTTPLTFPKPKPPRGQKRRLT